MSFSESPVFIVGWPRSGTTLLAKMLAAHPGMACGPESHLFSKISQGTIQQALTSDDWVSSIAETVGGITLSGQGVLELYGHTASSFRDELSVRKPSMPEVLSALYSNLMTRTGAVRIVEKTPNHICHLDRIRSRFPKSRIIRITRDPRDAVFSMRKLPWMPDDIVAGSLLWDRWFRSSKDFFENDPLSMTVRYEDLATNCKVVLEEICEFIGENFDPCMESFYESSDTVFTPGESWKEDVSQPIDASRIYSWKKNEVDKEDLSLVSGICHKGIRYFEYEPSLVEPLPSFEALDSLSLASATVLARGLIENRCGFQIDINELSGRKLRTLKHNLMGFLRLISNIFSKRNSLVMFHSSK
ncbi:sulfotransferase family protein [Haloferula sp.]|uniref:sulfotransferase family protein n=1 Tax=Haloferula sp. TaxID=2497595 RepID=UPI003C77855D